MLEMPPPPFDPGEDCLKLVTEALSLYSEGRTGKELREDKAFLEDWIETKTKGKIIKKELFWQMPFELA